RDAADRHDLRAERIGVVASDRDDAQSVAELAQAEWKAAPRGRPLLQRRVAIADAGDQAHQLDDDLVVGEPRDRAVEVGDRGLELILRPLEEEVLVASGKLLREEREVLPPVGGARGGAVRAGRRRDESERGGE